MKSNTIFSQHVKRLQAISFIGDSCLVYRVDLNCMGVRTAQNAHFSA
jgi:hypothetical protein